MTDRPFHVVRRSSALPWPLNQVEFAACSCRRCRPVAVARRGAALLSPAELGQEGKAAATLSVYYRSLQPFFSWAVSEGEIDSSPMERMKPPLVPEQPAMLRRYGASAADERRVGLWYTAVFERTGG